MNYQTFRVYKERIAAEREVMRFDCMNPFKAMDFLKLCSSEGAERSTDEVLDLWAQRMNAQAYRPQAIPSGGVRETLKALFRLYASQSREVWLPIDVYPFYWATATQAGLEPRAFPTLPEPDLSGLQQASDDSVLVITNPLSSRGRLLAKGEVAILKDWVSQSPRRQIVVDAVYTYTHGFDEGTRALYETGQCWITHSLSKSWLERGVFGINMPPERDETDHRQILSPPSAEASTSAYQALDAQPELPRVQQAQFSQEWDRLLPALRAIDPGFKPPETGYFSVLNASHEDALEQHGALTIPASVFGSSRADLSVVTCLYEIKGLQAR